MLMITMQGGGIFVAPVSTVGRPTVAMDEIHATRNTAVFVRSCHTTVPISVPISSPLHHLLL